MTGYIYVITNDINGKQYVGKLQIHQKVVLMTIVKTVYCRNAMVDHYIML